MTIEHKGINTIQSLFSVTKDNMVHQRINIILALFTVNTIVNRHMDTTQALTVT